MDVLLLRFSYLSVVIYVISFILAFLLAINISDFKNRYYSLYLQLKEIKFLINNAYVKAVSKDEQSLRSLLEGLGYKVEYISQKEDLVELRLAQVNPESMARLSYLLESNGLGIVFFKATDNTGQGNFFIELGVK